MATAGYIFYSDSSLGWGDASLVWNKVHLLPPYTHAWSTIPISLPNCWLQKMKSSHISGKEGGVSKGCVDTGQP